VRRLLPSALVALLCAASATAATPNLRRIVLSPAQVGPGYRMTVIARGTEVRGQVTLDLCGFTFPSEKLRVARLQVAYTRPRDPVQLSNEVVRYEPHGARQALREVAHAARHCPRGPVLSNVAGAPLLTYRIRAISDTHLLPGYVAFRLHYSGIYRGRKILGNAVGIYQAKGDVLSGVYTNGGGAIAAQLRACRHAAEQSALNLTRLA
jgi:hypothetical protein